MLTRFLRLRPAKFSGTTDPMVANDWLRSVNKDLVTVGCTDEEKVRFASHLLEGQVATWWDNFQITTPLEDVTWAIFEDGFTTDPMVANDWLRSVNKDLVTVGCTDEEKVRFASHLLEGQVATWWDNFQITTPLEDVTWAIFEDGFRTAHISSGFLNLITTTTATTVIMTISITAVMITTSTSTTRVDTRATTMEVEVVVEVSLSRKISVRLNASSVRRWGIMQMNA